MDFEEFTLSIEYLNPEHPLFESEVLDFADRVRADMIHPFIELPETRKARFQFMNDLIWFKFKKKIIEIAAKHKIYLNFGTHLGINVSKYNSVADVGISSSVIKKIEVRDKNIFTVGLSAGALRQRVIQFGDRVNISNQEVLYSFEGLLDYKRKLKSNNYISYGINYTFQTPYNKKNDFDHIILTGERVKTHWQHAMSHLYENLEGWNFIFTYSVKQFSYFIYAREDIKVDNAPDLQTGFGVKMSFKN